MFRSDVNTVLSFLQDLHNPASNLLDCSAGKKWLCCHDNKTRRSEVILELAKRSKITAIEIGGYRSLSR